MNKKPATQSLYTKDGLLCFDGEWDSKKLSDAITPENRYWKGRTVLDLGANTCGLSLELARQGAIVTAAEPDPYKNTKANTFQMLTEMIEQEELNLAMSDEDLFSAHLLGPHNTVLCLGLVYHFRDPQYVLDYLGQLDHSELIISTQTHPGQGLFMYNRKDPSVISKTGFWDKHTDSLSGWHPTKNLFEAMLCSAGYAEIRLLTDAHYNFPYKPSGLTNSSYYWCKKGISKAQDLIEARKIFYPR